MTVLEGVVVKPTGVASFGMSATGTLTYIAGRGDNARRTLVWVTGRAARNQSRRRRVCTRMRDSHRMERAWPSMYGRT